MNDKNWIAHQIIKTTIKLIYVAKHDRKTVKKMRVINCLRAVDMRKKPHGRDWYGMKPRRGKRR